ncbi:acyl-CoA N-acyltransferase [Pluteus cervinus]|uniref:Acyl-CoA N-acyltransferase n=1 Tax=Pluteus cervinus TaxID=181527 RepID=A0ACD3AJU5_9AGAR|nr:acyl-CoA N-acyltransferase [Pluteus cervinus]
MSQPQLVFRNVQEGDLEIAIEIERQGYPADEAASLEAFRYRQSQASDLFLGAYLPDTNELVGYVCSTLSPTTSLTHESMSNHIPGSATVCIHSVCVAQKHRRKGVGLALLQEYIARLEAAHPAVNSVSLERVLLITHEELREFYEKAGFEWVGESAVVHGSRPWYEMRRVFGENAGSTANATELAPPAIPNQAIQEALWANSTRPPPTGKPLSGFPGGILDVTLSESPDHGALTNRYDLICPQPSCGSVILKHNVAKWVERASVQLEPEDHPINPMLPALPAPPATTNWWLVGPSPMAFENVGFSRPVATLASATPMKLLACAECDLGPVGWHQPGGTEFWVACTRVAYKVD